MATENAIKAACEWLEERTGMDCALDEDILRVQDTEEVGRTESGFPLVIFVEKEYALFPHFLNSMRLLLDSCTREERYEIANAAMKDYQDNHNHETMAKPELSGYACCMMLDAATLFSAFCAVCLSEVTDGN